MQKALFFDGALALSDFARAIGARAGTESNLTACRVAHPKLPGESAYVIFGLRKHLFDSARSIRAKIADDGQILSWDLGLQKETPILRRTQAISLLELVSLVPWTTDVEAKASRGPVLFRIAPEQPEILSSLVSVSLQLGNDRMHCAPLDFSDDLPSGTFVLLRIEKPSSFLIQRCLEEYAQWVEIYYPVAEDAYVRWGSEHPFANWWHRSEKVRKKEWIFFNGGVSYFHVAPFQWQDIYDIIDVRLDFPHRELGARSPAKLRSFAVPLTLVKHAREVRLDPELWLLDDAGVALLEKGLQITDEETLRSWQIAVQKLEGDRDWIFIRETRVGKAGARGHTDFGGSAFARYQGLNNLLLPLGWELRPPLRRDAYRSLFALVPDAMTLLVPAQVINPDSPAGEFRVLRLAERAFGPIGSYVEYIVERQPEILLNCISSSIFDFGHYLKAPKHLLGPERGADKSAGPAQNLPILQAATVETENSEEAEDNLSLEQLAKPKRAEMEEPVDADQKEELRLEREISDQGQSLARWCELFLCKSRLRKFEDALLCATEGLWLAAGTAQEEGLRNQIKELARASAGDDPWEVELHDSEATRRAAALHLAFSAPEAAAELDQWLAQISGFLRGVEPGLRVKERWFAWGEVLRANQDVRHETLLRETIREEISKSGLRMEETPPFIRTRIFIDRQIDADSGAGSGVEAAAGNLEALSKVPEKIRVPRLQRAFRAIMARAFSQLQDFARTREFAGAEPDSTDPCAHAWESLFHIEALEGIDRPRAEALEARFETIAERADPETARAVRELKISYKERRNAENPAAFLAKENRARTYPRGPGSQQGKLYQLCMQLEEHMRQGQEGSAIAIMREMMTQEDKKTYDDEIKLPQFVEVLVTGIEHYKWGERGATLFPLYDTFCDTAPSFVSGRSNHLYGAILFSNLALGALAIDNLNQATKLVRAAAKRVCQNTGNLDFVDSAAALCRTVEQLPLNSRRHVLVEILEAFFKVFDQDSNAFLSNERLFVVVVKLLDQLSAAAVSKDRLSIRKFRDYQLQDEFLILQRVQKETFQQIKRS